MSSPGNEDTGLISILMPVRNAGPYLEPCLKSILQQTFPGWELVAVNDHSTDTSFQILERYARLDSRIRILQNTGRGIIPALRLALAHASGSLMTRMDADDVMVPHKLAAMRENLLVQGPGHLALGLVEYIADGPVGQGFRQYEEWLNGLTKTGKNFQDLYRECVIPSPCWMVFRSDLERAGAFRPDRYPEDYDLCFRFYGAGLTCIPSGTVLHKWRDHPGRASRNDPNYADHTFNDLKTYWFIRLHHSPARPLVLWGAGKKGKRIALLLREQGVSFHWVTNNKKKAGKQIHGVMLGHETEIEWEPAPRVIVAVASPDDQPGILNSLRSRNFEPLRDYYLFC